MTLLPVPLNQRVSPYSHQPQALTQELCQKSPLCRKHDNRSSGFGPYLATDLIAVNAGSIKSSKIKFGQRNRSKCRFSSLQSLFQNILLSGREKSIQQYCCHHLRLRFSVCLPSVLPPYGLIMCRNHSDNIVSANKIGSIRIQSGFKGRNCDTCVTFSLFAQTEGFHIFYFL